MGDALDGRTLLVHAEQGMGDMIQFCRFLPAAARGGRLLLEVHRPLVGLLAQLPGVAGVVGLGDALPAFDAAMPDAEPALSVGHGERTGHPAGDALSAPRAVARGCVARVARWRWAG